MDIKSTPMRTTLSFTLSILFHVSLVAGGAVLGAFFANNPQAPQAKGEQSYEVTVSEATAAPAAEQKAEPVVADIAVPTEPTPPPPVLAKAPAPAKASVPVKAKARTAAPAKKIVAINFSETKAEPQAVVEVNETLNESSETQEEVAVTPNQEESLVKSEDIKLEEVKEESLSAEAPAIATAEEVAEQKAEESKSEQSEALEKLAPAASANAESAAAPTQSAPVAKTGSPTGTETADAQATDTPATKEAPQNFLTLKQAPNNRPPSYPKELRLQQVQGKGQLKYYVNKDGRVGEMELTQSTGSPELDKVALDSFSKYKFIPGQEGYTVHNFEFSLKGPAEPEGRRLRTTLNK
jgi:TonB family protein